MSTTVLPLRDASLSSLELLTIITDCRCFNCCCCCRFAPNKSPISVSDLMPRNEPSSRPTLLYKSMSVSLFVFIFVLIAVPVPDELFLCVLNTSFFPVALPGVEGTLFGRTTASGSAQSSSSNRRQQVLHSLLDSKRLFEVTPPNGDK